jgi:hypothetical protein
VRGSLRSVLHQVVMDIKLRSREGGSSHRLPHPPRSAIGALELAMTLVSGAIFVAWALLAVVHLDDRYQLDHVGGARMALARFFNGGVLYPPLVGDGTYGGTRFMPLPIILHGVLARTTGEYLVSGKILGYAAMIMLLVVMVVLLVRMRCRLPLAVALAALVLTTHTGLAASMDLRADGLPLLLQLLAIALVAETSGRGATVGAAALSAMAVLSKSSAVWAPLAIAVWLLAVDRRRLGWFLIAYGALVGVLLALFGAVTDGRFFLNVFGLSTAGVQGPGSLLRGPYFLLHLLVEQALATWALLPIAAAGLWLAGRERRASLYQLSLVCCLGVLVVVLSDIGTGWNQLVDLVVLTALVVGELAGRSRPEAWPRWAITIPLVLLVLWVNLSGLVVTLVPDARQALGQLRAGHPAAGRPLAGRATSSTPLLSEDPYVPVALDQTPTVLDPFMLLRIGRQDPAAVRQLVGRISRREFRFVVLVEPLEPLDREWWRQLHFGPEVVQALAGAYTYTGRDQGYYVYEPSPRR